MTYSAARDACLQRGGDLASFKNPEEWAAIKEKVGPFKGWSKYYYWVGLEPTVTGWKWTDGTTWTGYPNIPKNHRGVSAELSRKFRGLLLWTGTNRNPIFRYSSAESSHFRAGYICRYKGNDM